MKVKAAELSIQTQLEINYMQKTVTGTEHYVNRLVITHKYMGSQQFSRVEYSTQIYRFDTRGAKEYLKVLAAELSIQPHLEINYLQQSDQQHSSLIVLTIVAATTVTVTVIAVICSKCNSDDSNSNTARSIRINT